MSDLNVVSKIRHLMQLYTRSTFLILILGLASTQSVAAATILVPPGGYFQAPINAASCRDTIGLHVGATYERQKWFENVQQFLKEFFDIVDYLFVRAFLVILAVMGAVSLIRHHKSKMQL